ncbi:MAG TPA: Uma2 family endonuclease [Humisphaera sp.]
MEAIARPDRMTVQEYFRREAVATTRHEYHDGVAFAIAGGTYNHSLITLDVGGELRARLKGKGCYALDSNLLVRIPRKAKYY